MPDYAPQLATLVKAPPSGDEWWHEIKFDGYRIGCRITGDRVSLISRNGKDWTGNFPEIAAAARALDTSDAVLDGEVAMLLPDGRTSFQALQNAAAETASRGALVYFVFDLLRLDGRSIEAKPLSERKAALRRLVGPATTGRIRYSEHIEGGGAGFLEKACALGLEGIVSKRRDRPYRHGRTADWLKSKCTQRQEFVIGGFTDPEGSRAGLGALLVGYYDGPRLVFSGKVGTGFTHRFAVDLRSRLDRLEVRTSPFEPAPPRAIARRAHWVSPDLVCEVTFTEWTGDGMIRHPAFQGLRADKNPREVRAERPAAVQESGEHAKESVARRARSAPAGRGSTTRQARSRQSTATAADRDVVAGVRISHPDRVLYANPALSKIDVARYYERIADWVVPHVEGRPLTLVRCPDGLSGKCFYMKHSKVWAPAPLRRVTIQEKTKRGEYLVADDLPAVVGLVQMGVLEIHTWNSKVDDVERPDRLVIDLDPGEHVPWPRVIDGARLVRKVLAALDLESYCKTTGGRGLHVVAPLVPHSDWTACLAFARELSEMIERLDPDRYTTQYAKQGREQKILLDYLRNNRTNTSVAAYSTRAREGAPVSVPLAWDELRASIAPASLTVMTVPQRLGRLKKDPWAGYWQSRQKLTLQKVRALGGHRLGVSG